MASTSLPRVLFVSKPIAPPFHDGSKCLVRDLVTHLSQVQPIVMTTKEAPPLGDAVLHERIYPTAGSFAPALVDNARVFRHLLVGPRPDLWHFVFAPNPASSTAATIARSLRRVPTVQTIASAPRSFEKVNRLLFGDRIVALSEHTTRRLIANGAPAERIVVIPPTVPRIDPPSPRAIEEARSRIGISDDRPLVVYAGDIEMSKGARLVAEAAPEVLSQTDTTIVYACRKKTPRAELAEAELRSRLSEYGDRIRFVGEVPSLVDLVAGASVMLFPVDDLYGKVDLPIAVLEAMALGIPVVALEEGPLGELSGIVHVDAHPDELARQCITLLRDQNRARERAEEAREVIEARHRPERAAAAYEAVYDELSKAARRG